MNPLAILGIIAALLGVGVAVEGKLLLDSHEKIGDLRVEVRNKQAVIDQKAKDEEFSSKLLAYQTEIEARLKGITNSTRQAINNAPDDNSAAVAALDSVRRSRAISVGAPAR